MTPERWEQVRRILEGALERPPAERTTWIARQAGTEPDLAREVTSLLRAHEHAGDFLEQPPGLDALPEGPELSGHSLGPYRVLELIDRGGMGSVFRAVRDDDAYEKEVAVKVAHSGLGSEAARERFRTEREILARLDHPNIARLMDGGTTSEGLPYLVMELVSGEPITRHVQCRDLSVAQILDLFRMVCAAVHYAHQNLVVHRDLKPDNILVEASGAPRLLDFGIARLLQPDTGEVAPTTGTFHHVTPEYASPEQLRSEAVTTSSDVYSLGVLLYELLAGRRPYEATRLQPTALLHEVCDVDPPPPSRAALHSATNAGNTLRFDPARRGRALEGDLDTIVLKALAKDPRRRYASAEGLGEDLRRHLAGLTVSARPDTFLYRVGKFVRRHRAGVAAAGVAAVAVVGFVTALAAQSAHLARERDRAESEAAKAVAVTRFLQDTLAAADPMSGEGRAVTVVEALEAAERDLSTSFAGAPETEAAVRETIGNTWVALGRFEQAEPMLRTALEMRRELHGEENLEVASSLMSLAELLRQQGRLEEAEGPMLRSLEMRVRLRGEDHPDVARALNNLAALAWEQGETDRAESHTRRALEILRRAYGDRHPDVAAACSNLAVLLEERGDLAEAERLYRSALQQWRALHGDTHPHVAGVASNLGLLLRDRGELDAAEPLLRLALATDRELLGPEHPNVGISEINLASLLRDRGAYEEASRHYEGALEVLVSALGSDHWSVARARGAWGSCLTKLGRYEEAQEQLRLAHERLTGQFGPEDERAQLVETFLAELAEARRTTRPSGTHKR